ncbi:helix-turn-helix transcriptional regulator [Streptomyces sp. NPDC026672]|uniref:helix-turn-helix transcriptional regulator n=1 Tax=unclassified Streptomyces TaxID=2593676 RepID=UPI0033D5FBFF
MPKNLRLAAAMHQAGLKQRELADRLNKRIEQLTGSPGVISGRHVRDWLNGTIRWPRERQRRVLRDEFGMTPEELGFIPPSRPGPSPDRRTFIGTAAGAAAAAALPHSPAPVRPLQVGMSDVIRLREEVERLIVLDDKRGGHGLEQTALDGAAKALALRKDSAATQHVQRHLSAVAADFTSAAAWFLIDAGRLDRADRHLDRALTLAGMAQDSDMTMKVWNLRAMLARQRHDFTEALAASQAAQGTEIARHSPLHASLAHARTAVGLAHSSDHGGALTCLERAEDAMSRVDERPPSAWIAFYGPAELASLTAIVRDVMGHPAEAEAASYRALAALPEPYRRNKALTTARLALAQLHQDEVEQGCATSGSVFTIMEGDPLPWRLRQLLGDFQRDLIARAPSVRIAHEWADRYRTEWSSP